jgi:hypothetical protein
MGPSNGSLLGDTVGPQLYRRNAFRLTGLRVDASARDIRRKSDELTALARLGGGAPAPAGPLPMSPPPDTDTVLTALEDLRDPARRLVQELFWLWPSDDHTAAVHNQAVLAHAEALDAEHDDAPERATHKWPDALAAWHGVLDSDDCWRWLDQRVRELADPRLTAETTDRLRRALPAALLSINAALAVKALDAGRGDLIETHVRLITGSGMPSDAVDRALAAVAEPMLVRIRRDCRRVLDAVDTDLSQVPAMVNAMLAETARPLWVLDLLYGPGVATRDGAHDDVALTALGGLIAAQRELHDDRMTHTLLTKAKEVAATPPAVNRIRENLEVVGQNLQWSTCWFCTEPAPDIAHAYEAKMFGDVHRERIYNGTRVTWKSGSVKIPRCASCAKQHGSTSAYAALFTTGIVLMAILGVVLMCVGVGWPGLVVCLVAAVALWLAGRPFYKPRSQMTKRILQFPVVVERVREGWQLGEKPSTS